MGVLSVKEKILSFSDEQEAGGVTFIAFPVSVADAVDKWGEVWEEAVSDLSSPPITGSVAASVATFKTTLQSQIDSEVLGMTALGTAADAAFPLLAAAIAPNLISVVPTPPFATTVPAAMAAFIPGTTDPVAPAQAFATVLQTTIATAVWTPPAGVPPSPFVMGA